MSKISRYPVPEINDLPDDLKNRILEVQEKAGFVPNVFLTLAHRPDELRAFMAYHDALMERESGLTIAEKEMIVVATSNDNECQYCVIAHGAILRVRAKNSLVADQVAVNYRKADITPKQKAMLDFAMKVSKAAGSVSDEDFDRLRHTGSATRMSGTSQQSRRFLACRTGWPISHRCARMTNSTRWVGSDLRLPAMR